MTVNGLDHINIQTQALDATAQFFADVLGLRPGVPPGRLDPMKIRWLFDASDRALIHLSTPGTTGGAAMAAGSGTGALDHIAFDCSGHAAMIERLDRLGVAYRNLDVPGIGLQQVFVSEPNGVRLELNFRAG